MTLWLGVRIINVWNIVTLFLDLLVEFFRAIAESGSLNNTVPFLGTLAVSVRPPLLVRVSVGISVKLSCSSESIRVTCWLSVLIIDIWNEITLQIHFGVEGILTIYESGSFFNAVPLLRALTISVCPPLNQTLLTLRYLC